MSSEEKVSLKQLVNNTQQAVDQAMESQSPPMWDVPVSEVRLPSGGKVYKQDSPLYMRESLEIRSMTAREEDILTSRVLLRQGKAMSMLLKNCLVDKNIDPDEMISGDRNALLVAIRVSGYGAEYETKIECPECSHAFEHNFDLSNVHVDALTIEPVSPGQNLFEFLLPISKRKVLFQLLTGAQERELSTIQDRSKKAKGMGLENNVTLRLFHQVVSIDNETDRSKIQRLVTTMSAGDSRALRKFIEKVSPGLDMSYMVACPSCGDESEVDMPIGAEFFWPGA